MKLVSFCLWNLGFDYFAAVLGFSSCLVHGLVSGSQTVGVGGVPRGRRSRQGWPQVMASDSSGGDMGVPGDYL